MTHVYFKFTGPMQPHITPELLGKLRHVGRFFPELEGKQIRVGLSKKRHLLGVACAEDSKINLYVGGKHPSRQTIGHELMHLVQGISNIPDGERSCDLYVCARSPFLLDEPPFYLELPRQLLERWTRKARLLVHRSAKESLLERTNGRKQYIRWFEKNLAVSALHLGDTGQMATAKSLPAPPPNANTHRLQDRPSGTPSWRHEWERCVGRGIGD